MGQKATFYGFGPMSVMHPQADNGLFARDAQLVREARSSRPANRDNRRDGFRFVVGLPAAPLLRHHSRKSPWRRPWLKRLSERPI
jgi:hypothetical protein